MNKIIFVVPDMAGGGTEKVISLLANEYVRRGREVGILLFAGSQLAYPLDERVEVFSAGEASGGDAKVRIKRVLAMRRYFKKNRDAYIFSFSTRGTGFIVVSTLFMKRRMLVSERTDPNKCDFKNFRDFFYRFCKVLVCQTSDSAKSFPPYLTGKCTVIENPIDPDLAKPYTGERSNRIVHVGRLVPVKNQRMLIEAFAKVHEKLPQYTLHIYGQGELEQELKDYAESLQAPVVFEGFCKKVDEKIADAAAFVLCSNYEGISNSMCEALALGIPTVATDCPIGGCRSYIRHGENGMLVPVGDADALAKALMEILSDPEYAARLSASAVAIRDQFSVARIADRMVQVLEERL